MTDTTDASVLHCPACGAPNKRRWKDGVPRYCVKPSCRAVASQATGKHLGVGTGNRADAATQAAATALRLEHTSRRIARLQRDLETLQALRERLVESLRPKGPLTDDLLVRYIRAYRNGTFATLYGDQAAVALRHGIPRGSLQPILAGRRRKDLQALAS